MAKRLSRESYARSDAAGGTFGKSSLIAGEVCQPLPNSASQWFDQALEVGLHRSLHIREERLSARHDACRLLYVSDIHLRSRRSDRLCGQVLEAVATCRPDLILLGGDLVDRSSELVRLSDLVRRLCETAPVLAVGGNHDDQVGMDCVRRAVECSGGQWIHDSTVLVRHGDRMIAFSGPEATTCGDGHVRVLCAHNPRSWKASRHIGYDLVLAGHLHGCQIVACQLRGRLYPGALLYPNCVLSYQRGLTRLVVSRGVSDLVPIRWRCPREVVVCCV
jgi:predicted MPP superfamily phosphohydrolase